MTTAVRPMNIPANAVIRTMTASGTVTANMPQTFATETTCADSTSGENASAIALTAGTTGDLVQVALLCGGAVIPVQVGTAGCTMGKFAKVGTTGCIDATAGGGTTVMYCQGWFTQTGVTGDVVGLA